jgi:hypothetical protein
MAVENYPMIYDVETNLLKIWGNSEENEYEQIGYSEETSFDFNHIKEYALYLNNNLSIDIVREDGYEFDFILEFEINSLYGGNTYFIDTNKLIQFNKVGISNNTYTILIKNGVHWQIGHILNDNKKTSKSGCSIFINQEISYSGGICNIGTGGIYSSHLNCLPTSLSSLLTNWQYGDVWNTRIENGAIYKATINVDFYNVSLENGNFNLYYTNGNFNKLNLTGGYNVGRIRNAGSHDVIAKNVYARGNTYFLNMFNCSDGSKVDITDGDIDVWDTYTGTISDGTVYVYRRYTFNLKIKDSQGNTLESANILITNNNDDVLFDGLSDENGTINEQVLLVNEWRYTKNNDIIEQLFINYNPIKTTVSKDGYSDYILFLDVESKTSYTISLKEPEPLSLISNTKIYNTNIY